jgi:hypothetical protein
MTQDLHSLVPELCGAIKAFESDPASSEALVVLLECCRLLGRFIAPDSYVPFLLPRFRGELEVMPGGTGLLPCVSRN